ncbi:MAG: SPOR domain-containing protein [Deltaproteobacteria bacterium]|nr:SPOR domain-containing protein [Deltaproteobacteria bacterium]
MTRRDLIFSKFWQIIKKRRHIIIFTAIALLTVSVGTAMWKAYPPLYKSTCSIKFEKEETVGGLFSRVLSSAESGNIETQQVIITSYDLLADVARNLSLISGAESVNDPGVYTIIEDLRTKVSFEKEDAKNIIHISVTDRDPSFARNMANELAETYNRRQSEQQQKRLNEAINYIDQQLKTSMDRLDESEDRFNRFSQDNQLLSIDHQSGNLLLRKKELEDEIRIETNAGKIAALELDLQAVDKKINELMDKKLEFNRLKKEFESSESMYSFLEEKKQEAMIRLAERPDAVEIIKQAQLASRPLNSPDIAKAGLTGLIAGILLGLITAFLAEIFSSQTGLLNDIENNIGLKVLGVIPQSEKKDLISGVKTGQDKILDESSPVINPSLVSHFAPKTMLAESFRALRTIVLLTGEHEKARRIGVTSSYPREGKSMVSANLAISMAQAGLKTLLVESDFRNPVLGKKLYVEDGPGLTDVLLGNSPWQDAVKTVTDMIMGGLTMEDIMTTPGLDNLNIITSGPVPSNPAELISSQRFVDFMEAVEKEYDLIIVDSAPVLTTAETAILGVKMDALLIVYRSALVTKEMLKKTYSQLKQVKANILGVVLNGVKPDLIKDAFWNKYPQYYSAEALPDKPKEITVKEKKKNRPIRILILIEVIILLVSIILWRMGIIFPEKFFPPETEVKKEGNPPAMSAPAEEGVLPDKEIDNLMGVAPLYIPDGEKKEIHTASGEAIINADEKEASPLAVKPVYQEGTRPYSVYLGSFRTLERARIAVDEYAQKGIRTFPVKLELAEKGVWYRVYSGSYPDARSAEAFIKENGLQGAEIKKTAYACYIDSFTNNETLEDSIGDLKEKQFFPYVIIDNADNVHFLFAGAFISRNGAQELSEELRANGIENKVVSR